MTSSENEPFEVEAILVEDDEDERERIAEEVRNELMGNVVVGEAARIEP